MENKFSELSNRVIGCAIEVHRQLSQTREGLLINFNVEKLKDGLRYLTLS